MNEKKRITMTMREACERYGLSRTALTKIGKENGAIMRVGNKYILQINIMDDVIRKMAVK